MLSNIMRIEDYVTSIILSYVDKYIIDFKRQDAQVSIWEGEASFHNLDLDLETLDQELNLPISFVSGHIHELLIHVPWTRVSSEPVKITINTIECVMKMKTPGQKPPQQKRKKKPKKPTGTEEAPPSYTASLANRIISNLSVTCNNLILKYVEEDIVLSMNIKTLSLNTVNKNWIEEFSVLTHENLILRKLVRLTDVTICLDKRSVSGRIESYLEPLLYKCSLSVKISKTYPSTNSQTAVKTRIAVHTDNITLNISEPQVPMLLRLIVLARAAFSSPRGSTTSAAQTSESSASDNTGEGEDVDGGGEGWGTWAWSMLPSIFPHNYSPSDPAPSAQSLDFGCYMDTFSLDLKLVEEGKLWESFMKATLQGCFAEMSTNTTDWTNFQFGICFATLYSLPFDKKEYYLICGDERPHYKDKSLFENPDANLAQRTWDLHLATVTEKCMVERSPALSMDYISSLEVPPDNWIDNNPSENLERMLLRYVIGPLEATITPGLLERVSIITKTIENSDYPLYISSRDGAEDAPAVVRDPTQWMTTEGNVPQFVCQFTIVKSTVKLYTAFPESHTSLQNKLGSMSRAMSLKQQPYLCLRVKCLDGRFTKPLHPERLPSGFMSRVSLSRDLIAASMTTVSVVVLVISMGVTIDGIESPDMLQINKLSSNVSMNTLFQNEPDTILRHCSLQIESCSFTSTKAKLLLSSELLDAFISKSPVNSYVYNSSMIQDVINSTAFPLLQLSLNMTQVMFAQSHLSESAKVQLGSIEAKSFYLGNSKNKHQFNVISAFSTDENGVLEVVAQRPLGNSASVPFLVYFKLRQFHVYLDMSVFKWLTYTPRFRRSHLKKWSSASKFGSGGSRKISNSSVSSLSKTMPKIAESLTGKTSSSVEQPAAAPTTSESATKELEDELGWLMNWLSVVVCGEMTDVQISHSTSTSSEACSLCVIFPSTTITSAQGMCDIDTGVLPVTFEDLKKNSISFPWNIEIRNVHGHSRVRGSKEDFLEKFSIKCTVALTSRVFPSPLLAFSIHIDTEPFILYFNVSQMCCLSDLLVNLSKMGDTEPPPPVSPRQKDLSPRAGKVAASSSEESQSLSAPPQQPTQEKGIERMKVTCWVQWTITKVTLCLITAPLKKDPETLKLAVVLEDVIASMDMETVYQKIKLKIGASTIKHYSRSSSKVGWKQGRYGGMMMRVHEGSANNAEFLSLTLTRAKASSFHAKLASSMRVPYKEVTGSSRRSNGGGGATEDGYISEVVVRVEPLDLILVPGLAQRFVGVVGPLLAPRPPPPGPPRPHLTTAHLPLIYLDIHQITLFIISSAEYVPQDTLVINLNEISLRSEAVNPVSRKLLREDIARVTSVPGARVEDRQYQLDINTQISTGRWELLESFACGVPNKSVEENPAVAWNSGGGPPSSSAPLSTILEPLGVTFIFAPPILVSGVIVSGLYFEGNVISEAEISLSLDQMRLLVGLSSELAAIFPDIATSPSACPQDPDSGIESSADSFSTNSKDSFEERVPFASVPSSQISVSTSTSINTKGIRQRTQIVPSDVLLIGKGFTIKLFLEDEQNSSYMPLFYLSVTQPYVALEKHGDTIIHKASMFDLLVKHGGQNATVKGARPNSDDFSVALLETREGDPDPDKGIPPALFNFRAVVQGMKLPTVDVEMGRPIKLTLKMSSIEFLTSLWELILTNTEITFKSSTVSLSYRSSNVSILNLKRSNGIERFMRLISGFNISTKQIAVECQPAAPSEMSGMVSVSELAGHITFPASAQAAGSLSVSSLALAVGGRLVLTPWSFSTTVNMSSELWSSVPILKIGFISDILSVEIHPTRVKAMKDLIEEYEDLIATTNSETDATQRGKSAVLDEEEDEVYREDLQTGAFVFASASAGLDALPLAYQILFPTPTTMAWAYPQPRAVVALSLLPVPFSMNRSTGQDGLRSDGVEVSLEYLEEAPCTWTEVAQLRLSESLTSKWTLDGTPRRAATVWRVVMLTNQPPIHVQALGGCVKVDSLFSPRLIPRLMVKAGLSRLTALLWAVPPANPAPVGRYTPAKLRQRSYPFCCMALQGVKVTVRSWHPVSAQMEAEAHFRPRVNLLNPRTLKEQTIIPPFPMEARLRQSRGGSFRRLLLQTGPVSMSVAPSLTHLLSAALHQGVLHPYVVCNDTALPIRFRQCGTDEDLHIDRLQCYFYSWKDTSRKLELSFSISNSAGAETWSEGVSLASQGSFSIEVPDLGDRPMNILITIKKLSATVLQVVVSGELGVRNLLDREIQIRVVASTISERQRMLSLKGGQIGPSLILGSQATYNARLSFGAGWSGLIPLAECAPWLVKVPLKEAGTYLSTWCQVFKEEVANYKRMVVVMSPMYQVRSLLPCDANITVATDSFSSVSTLRVTGKGALTPLYTPGTTEDRHSLTFHIDGNIPSSSPHLTLAYGEVVQSSPPQPSSKPQDMEDLLSGPVGQWKDWPLLGPPWHCVAWKPAPQPDTVTRIKVRFCGEKLKVTNSILIELEPWCLVVNTIGTHLTLQSIDRVLCSVPHLSIVAPPLLESTFNIVVELSDGYHRSNQLQLSDNQSFYKPHIAGLIPQIASVNFTIEGVNSVVFGALHSKMVNGIRLLHITSAYVISNLSSYELHLTPVAVRATPGRKLNMPGELSSHAIHLPPKSGTKGVPVPEWFERSTERYGDRKLYLLSRSGANPVRLPSWETEGIRAREALLLPLDTPRGWFNAPLSVVFQEKGCTTYITIDDDPSPQLVVHNHTRHYLAIAAAGSPQGGRALEECEDWEWRLVLAGGRCGHYRIAAGPGEPLPPVVVAKPANFYEWSSAISLRVTTGARLVNLPGGQDLVATVTKSGFTTHLYLAVAHQSLISAGDVRSRLSLQVDQASPQPVTEERQPENEAMKHESKIEDTVSCDEMCRVQPSVLSQLEVRCAIRSITLSLCSEDPATCLWTEVANLSLDTVNISLEQDRKSEESAMESHLKLTVWSVQLDNQEHLTGDYDFSVVLIASGSGCAAQPPQNASLPPSSAGPVLGINVGLGVSSSSSPVIQSVEVKLSPVELFLEDSYLLRLKDCLLDLNPLLLGASSDEGPLPPPEAAVEVAAEPTEEDSVNGLESKEPPAHFSPPVSSGPSSTEELEPETEECWSGAATDPTDPGWCLPVSSEITQSTLDLSKPLRLKLFLIEPVEVRVSLHTSTKFYIAVDQSPVSFAEFRRTDMVTTPFRLGHALTLHYFLGAIYGTGWALGSLQLLGAPAGLARSLGAGLSSFISLPCRGLVGQGPTGFLLGVIYGSAALLRHVTAGTLSSLTKLAGSWSRTLDRLTLTEEDLRYVEEMRRLRPTSLGEGLKLGFTEFGVSLLGGLGGLAQRPLEYALISSAGGGSGGGARTATHHSSFAGCVGRGLVGAVARPLSGAAGFLAVTSQGILAGAGWTDVCRARSGPNPPEEGHDSLLSQGPGTLLMVEATSSGLEPVDLVLALSNLSLVSRTGARHLSLRQLSALPDRADPTLVLLYLTTPDHLTAESYSQRRVVEFVRESQRALGSALPPSPPPLPSPTHDTEPLFFYLAPELRDYFVAFLSLVARHSTLRGFPLITDQGNV